MKQLFFIIIMLALEAPVKAQDKCNCPQQSKQGKGTLYFTGGYNFDWFAKSDLHFEDRSSEAIEKGNDYSFTIYNVKVVDKKDEIKDIFHEDITIPQYSFRIGYWFNGKHDLGVELNYDHAKYKMLRNQRVHLKGEIRGQEYDKDVSLDSANFGYYPFLWFEHSNGANFCLVDIVKRANIIHNKNKKLWLGA